MAVGGGGLQILIMMKSRNDLNASKDSILPPKGNQFQIHHLVCGMKNLKSRV